MVVFLNNAGTSYPKPESVVRAVADGLAQPPTAWREPYERACGVVAGALGVAPDELLFTAGCTQALDVALSELPFEAGDEIVTSQLEHHAVIRPVQRLAQRGVNHEASPYAPGRPFDLDFLETRLRTGRVRLVVVSSASNVTGEVLPLADIAALAHRYGARVLADLAQTFGLLPDRIEEIGCDLAVFAGHKNPLGPQGIGGLWASRQVRFACRQARCEIGPSASTSAPRPGHCEVGGVNVAGLMGLAAGLEAHGPRRDERMRGARAMARELARAARDVPGVNVFGHSGSPQTAVVSLRHERLPPSGAEAYFAGRGIAVRAGAHCAPGALEAIGAVEGTLRISFGPSNVEADLGAAVEAIRAVP